MAQLTNHNNKIASDLFVHIFYFMVKYFYPISYV